MKNPTEELTGHILFTLVVGYFAALNMTYFLSPIGALRHFPRRRKQEKFSETLPRRRKQVLFYCLCERSEAISREGGGLRSIFSVLFQGDCRGTSCLAMTTSRAMVRWDISLSLNMTYFLSPIGGVAPLRLRFIRRIKKRADCKIAVGA